MKKWEYRVENISASNFSDEKTLREVKEFLANLGNNGWELLQVVPIRQVEEVGLKGKRLVLKDGYFIFKKEVE
ncbi:DUF4177 domain-containing protein [bacterium]|nr:DUF4177 domain-containing protein [bacterium]